MKKHRNSQKRIYFEDAEYFVTCKTQNNYPYFKEKIFCDLFVENLRVCKKLKGFVLYGWVLIWDHFHLLLRPSDEFNISDVMFSIKKQFSHNINRVIGYHPIPEGAQALARLRGNNRDFIEIYKQHDKYVSELKTQFRQKYSNQNPYHVFQWQKSYHDHYVRNDDDFGYHMGYIAYNPIKHGLPDNWPYIFTNDKYADLIDDCL